MPIRITQEDILDASHMPAVIVINAIHGSTLIRVLTAAAEKVGFGNDFGGCSFQDDLDPWERPIPPNCVECALNHGDTAMLSFKEYYYYLEKYVLSYIKDCPKDKEIMDSLLEHVKLRFGLSHSVQQEGL